MRTLKITILALLLTGIGLAAFRLSFDAQVTLATAAGVTDYLAGLYPLIVDAAIIAGVLIRLWHPELERHLTAYLWSAIAFWTLTSILGNAFHVLALPADRISLPPAIAIGVNTLPALTLFLVIHLSTTTAFRAKPTPPVPTRTRSRATAPSEQNAITAPSTRTRADIPPITDQQLLALADQGLSFAQIATEVGRSKSYVGARIKTLRDERLSA